MRRGVVVVGGVGMHGVRSMHGNVFTSATSTVAMLHMLLRLLGLLCLEPQGFALMHGVVLMSRQNVGVITFTVPYLLWFCLPCTPASVR